MLVREVRCRLDAQSSAATGRAHAGTLVIIDSPRYNGREYQASSERETEESKQRKSRETNCHCSRKEAFDE